MGAGFSSNYDTEDEVFGLGDVPESCVAFVLYNLDPQEICRLARLNKAFHRASSADFVWESKLPSNYEFLVKTLLVAHDHQITGLQNLSKKDIYATLCKPNRFDGGSKEVWLDKSCGRVCLCISSKALKITGIDDRRYWTYIPTEESRFQCIAFLQQMWWVEVHGELEFEFPEGSYSLFFRLQLGKPTKRFGRRVCNLDQVHGWDIKPVRFQLSTSNGHNSTSERYLQEPGNWANYHVGDFVIQLQSPNNEKLTKIKFSMVQIDCTHSKGGLCLDSVLICPTELGKGLKTIYSCS